MIVNRSKVDRAKRSITHDLALELAERFQLSFYDGLIVAAAALAKCTTLYSEDMQDGQTIEGVPIRNPFVSH